MKMEKFMSLLRTVHSHRVTLSEGVAVSREVPSRHTPAVLDTQVAFHVVCGKLVTSPVTKRVAVLSYVSIGLKNAVRCHCNMLIDLPKLIIIPPESGRTRDVSHPPYPVHSSKIYYSNSDHQGNKTCGPFYSLMPKPFVLAAGYLPAGPISDRNLW